MSTVADLTSTPGTPVGPRGLAVRCTLQGLAAAAAGEPVTGCPYRGDRPFSRRAWVRGYLAHHRAAGARMPVDVADDVDEDAPTP